MSQLVTLLKRPNNPLVPVPANPERQDIYWLKEQVADAKAEIADPSINLMQPRRALFHHREVMAHRNRFVGAVGGLSGASLWGKTFLWVAFGAGCIAVAMLVNPWTPIWADIGVILVMVASIMTERMVAGAYREGFVKVYLVERRDFTDPSQTTAIQTVWLPRLGFYFRPEVWHGSDGHSGYLDAQAVVILQVPEDQSIDDILYEADYWDLPADEYGLDDTGGRALVAWARDLLKNGAAFTALGLPEKQSMSDIWPWVAGGVELLVGLGIIIFAGGA